jgi:hypothetical protein
MASKSKPTPRIHELKPQPTIAKAVAAASAHVQAVNKAARRGRYQHHV